jgi:hypothetical protein
MPLLEASIQHRFFHLVRTHTSQESSCLHEQIQVYCDLVEHRFDDVLSHAFPILRSKISHELWISSMRLFIQSHPKSPIVWQMAGEFRAFLLKTKPFYFPWLFDLLWFEWMEIQSMMAIENRLTTVVSWEWTEHWNLANSAFIRRLRYPVHRASWNTPSQTHLLLYCHQEEHEVYYLEITPFLFRFLRHIHMGKKPIETLRSLCRTYQFSLDGVKNLLKDLLKDFVNQGILVPV